MRFCFLILSCLLLAACGPAQRPEDALIIAQSAEPRTLDPQRATGNTDFQVASQIFEGLVRFAPNSLRIEPALAERWEIEDEGKTYRFFLRRNVHFHDGTALNADAVVFNFERMLNPDHPAADSGPFPLAFFFSSVESIVAENDYVVTFKLKEPFAPLLSNLAYPTGYIGSPKAITDFGKEYGRHPVGTGPFRFLRWDSRRRIVLEATNNPKDQSIKKLYYRPIPDENTRLTDLLSGQVDLVLDLPAALTTFLRNHPDYSVKEATGPHLWFVILNLKHPLLANKRVRQALNYAINKEAITRDLLQNTATVPGGPIPEAFDWIGFQNAPYPYNPDKAQALLDTVMKENPDLPIDLTLLATESGSGMLEPTRMAEAIQADLQAIGLKVKIEVYEWNSYLAKVNAGLDESGDLAEMAWMVNDPDTLPYLALRRSAWPDQGGFNSGYYENPIVEKWIEEARVETDIDRRAALYRKIQQTVHDDAPWLFIASWKQTIVFPKDLEGVAPQPSFLVPLSRAHWKEKKE